MVEVVEVEIAHSSDRTQFCIRSKILVPFVLVQLVSKITSISSVEVVGN